MVASGSNAALSVDDLLVTREIIRDADIVLLQLEIPISTVEYVVDVAASSGVRVILNPAPAAALPDHLLKQIHIITPNETEAEMLTGIAIKDESTAILAAKKLKDKGVAIVIITMGAKGALLLQDDSCIMIPAPVVKAVDTTAAGDVFNGALAVALSGNDTMSDAVRYACSAAAISVTRLGAQSSAPHKNEVI